ncbi:PQQ-dependent sugar dehydrogenase [Pseudoduganella buxea]|uniref:Glucose dehydrogenase n=1 Tax=Pseudoduganella buxea TaxID=1949069 RepID=A0A6I3SW81_9BURK|nr:PQQ-dependent sugar dehydrogenase [Pseudoduganella buxea]MTV52935.1 glucose dehydrogenase [Pseudoduganella buxea]GGC16700.1 glucose dehydrogenase [Pseudoduganella buxea]
MRVLMPAIAVLLLASCGGGGSDVVSPPPAVPPTLPPAPPPTPFAVTLREVATNLDQPVLLTAPAGDARQFIAERTGRIRILADGALRARPFLDVSARVSTAGEGGLLGLAFHPRYAQNGSFFIYSVDTAGNIAIDRGTVSADANVADPQSLRRVITIPHPGFTNHYGGMLAFGPDGYLYVATGDGGGAGDPNGNSQNPLSLLGKMLRLDVATEPYAIPPDNPWIALSSRRGEIWALGLRNPWRFAFDGGQLYIADVGQNAREEVDIAPATQAVDNYGWNVMEGSRCYANANCSTQGLVLPRFEYEHGSNGTNGCSITGGFVYRGSALPELAGRYLYSDYCKGFLKSFLYADGRVSDERDWNIANVGNVQSFGQDGQGELYLLSASGSVFRIVRR